VLVSLAPIHLRVLWFLSATLTHTWRHRGDTNRGYIWLASEQVTCVTCAIRPRLIWISTMNQCWES